MKVSYQAILDLLLLYGGSVRISVFKASRVLMYEPSARFTSKHLGKKTCT